MSYPPPSYPGYPPAAPAYPAGYDPRSSPYGYPPPADPAAAPQAPPADPYAAAYAYPPQPAAQPGPAPAAPQTAPATQPAAAPAAQAPPQDPYAQAAQAHYDYYRTYYPNYPPPAYPGYPPPGPAPDQSQAAVPAAQPAPQAHAPPSYPTAPQTAPAPGAPPHGAPPAQPEYPPAGYPPAYPGYPGYDPSRPPDPYAHYAHYPPPAYPGYPPPGYPPAPYAYPPPHGHPAPAAPPQDRDRDRDRRRSPSRRDRKRDSKPPPRPEKRQKVEPDARAKLYRHIQQQKGWSLFWLEGIDPPTRAITNPNVTMLILTKGASGPASSFGFLLAASRQPQKQKDRQRECMKDLLLQVEQLLAGKSEADLRSWCQIHDPQAAATNGESQESDLEKLKGTIASRLTSTGTSSKSAGVELQMVTGSSCVIVSAAAFDESEYAEDKMREKSQLPDLVAMNFFSADAGALLEEAQKLGGLLRAQWHLAVVKATRNSKDDRDQPKPLALGVGFATDEALSKARALRAAEIRAEVLTEAMFLKSQK